ncbi:MAG: septum formation family protein [Nocardioidaceae bacterium]|nr:septum formation family protein [Nocardioidaceae bacterium]
MHTWYAALTLAGLLALSGCSRDAAEPAPLPVGAVGDCYAKASKAVDCAAPHLAETVFVAQETPPRTPAAIAPCQTSQARYLGQDFNTRLDVHLWVASDESWYRCDVVLPKSTHTDSGLETVTGSLRGALRNGVPVELQACLGEQHDQAIDQPYTSCDTPHKSRRLIVAPAVGTVAEPFPADIADRATRACNASAAAERELVGSPRVQAFFPDSAAAWDTGDRSADCWVVADSGLLPAVTPANVDSREEPTGPATNK